MYFGNTESILEYDGFSWNKISIPGQSYILSLATAPNGIVYVGGTDDFGFLDTDNSGQLYYKTLRGLMSDSLGVNRVWKTYTSANNVYFCTLQRVFVYNYSTNTITSIDLPENSFWSFLVNDTLYIDNYNSGLHYLDSNELTLVNGGKHFAQNDIFSILPWDRHTLLIANAEKGLSLLNTQSGQVSEFVFNTQAKQTNKVLIDKFIYAGTVIDSNHFAFATRLDGLFIINRKGEIVTHINKETGLPTEMVTNIYLSSNPSGVIWLSLINGITSVNVGSPIRVFSDKLGLKGTIYGIAHKNKSYYAATMYGVSLLEYHTDKTSQFIQVDGIAGEEVYSIINFEHNGQNKLLAASVRDIYEIKGKKATPLNFGIETYQLVQSKLKPELIYVATSRGIRTLKHQNGSFKLAPKVFALADTMITRIIEDTEGNIWCNTLSGAKLLTSNGKHKALPLTVTQRNGNFFSFRNLIHYTADGDVYEFDSETGSFEKSSLNAHFKPKGRIIKDVFTLTDSSTLISYEQQNSSWAATAYWSNSGWRIDTCSMRIIPSMTIASGSTHKNLTFVGGQEGLFVHNNKIEKDFKQSFKTLIRKVSLGYDSTIYKGAGGFENLTINNNYLQLTAPLTFKYNYIDFAFSSPYFESESQTLYQSYLEGYDKTWSAWEEKDFRNYTNLSEGTYLFHVKAKNIYGNESEEAIFEFRILPPWYRTWWALLIYIALAFVIIRLSIAWYTRKLQEDNRKLEAIVKERTAEVVEKNKKIEQQNIAITDSIRYAKRIQTAVLPDKQTCKLFDYFIYFAPKDIVSGDFYWVHHFEKQKRLIFIAADCTGHGVPGAFMSMLGTSFLNEIVAKLDINHSDSILNHLRHYVINTLSQGLKEGDKDERKDGMDMALVSIDLNSMILEFSGANNPLVFIRNGELTEYKPDKMPIGAYVKQNIPFKRTEIQLQPGDTFYMFSDGYVDQFGGPDGRKYMKKNFKDYLLSIHHLPFNEQKEILRKEMNSWMEGHEQIDDQIVLGVKANF
jgi:serine phosphatase RsbU (regulator of sigma subunit)